MDYVIRLFRSLAPIIFIISSFIIASLLGTSSYLNDFLQNKKFNTTAIIFFLINLNRILLLFSSAYVVFKQHYKTAHILLLTIVIETVGLIANYYIIKVPSNLLWLSTSILPLFFLVALYLLKHFSGNKTEQSISQLIQNTPTTQNDPAITADVQSFIFKKSISFFRIRLSNIVLILFVLGIAGATVYYYKDYVKNELKYFLNKTSFMSDSGMDKVVEKIPFKNVLHHPKGRANSKTNSKSVKGNSKKLSQAVKKDFRNRVYSKRALKKKTSHYEIGHAYLSAKNYKLAIVEFEKSLSDPLPKYTLMLAHYFLAKTYEKKLKDKRNALKHWLRLKKMPQHRVKFQMNLPKIAVNEVRRLKFNFKNINKSPKQVKKSKRKKKIRK